MATWRQNSCWINIQPFDWLFLNCWMVIWQLFCHQIAIQPLRLKLKSKRNLRQMECIHNIYHPQTKFAKVMFLHMSVVLFTGRGWYSSMHCRSPGSHPGEKVRGLAWGGAPGPHPGGKLRGLAWGGAPGPHPGGKLRGLAWGELQVHTQGGSWEVWPGGVSRSTPGVSRPTPWGGLQAHTQGGLQAHTQGGYPSMHWGRHPPPQQTATAAGDTHPTGMHSCLLKFFKNHDVNESTLHSVAGYLFWRRGFRNITVNISLSCWWTSWS